MIRHALGGLIGIFLSASAVLAEPINLTVSGGSPGGLWSLIGAGLDRAIKAEDADGVITYQTSGGGFANIALLANKKTDLGLVHDAEVQLALQGKEPFDAPITNLRAIGYMYNWAPMHFFLEKSIALEYGIDSLDDLATSGAPLKIGVNRPGNINSDVVLFMLEAAGLDQKTLEANGGTFVRAASKQQAELIRDGRIDLATNGVFVGHSSFRVIDENIDGILLSVPADVIAATNAAFGTVPSTIPANSYSDQTTDIASISLGAMVVTNETLPYASAEKLAQSLLANIDDVRGVHKAMSGLTTKLLVSQTVLPFHPAAEAVYRDAGLFD